MISIPEENWVLFEAKLHKAGQALGGTDGNPLDEITARTNDGHTQTVYFDISPFYPPKPARQ